MGASCLTHWGRGTHICVSKLAFIGSDNGLSPGRRQAIIWTSAGILLIRPLGTNFNEMLIEILTFSLMKMRLKVSSAKRRPFCLGPNVLIHRQLLPPNRTQSSNDSPIGFKTHSLISKPEVLFPLHWRHNDHDGVSDHQPYGCLLNRVFRRRSKKTSKLRVTGLCVGNSPGPVNSPHKGPVTRKMFPFDDVIMSITMFLHVVTNYKDGKNFLTWIKGH